MRLTSDANEARRILLENRGIDIGDLTGSVSDSAQNVFGRSMTLVEYVQRIIDDVRDGGDSAIQNINEKIDGYRPESLVVSQEDIEAAYYRIDSNLREALEFSAQRISEYHELCRIEDWNDESKGYGQRFIPVYSAASYVPGGTAKYPSTVLMTSIPAQIAGVKQISITCPSNQGKNPPDSVLAAAHIAKVDCVYAIGGAQSIAALAYGTETVNAVDMICGPGNIFVTLAKKLVYGDVGIDGLYGPTETVILADRSANPVICAADLLAQAEHDILAKPVLITTSASFATEVSHQIEKTLSRMSRSEIAGRSIHEQGVIVVVEDLQTGIDISNEFAPEHLSIVTEDPESLVPHVRNAGMVFLGEFSHEVLGDYGAGPSHVMPTAGTARFNSGLGLHSFLKYVPVVSLSRKDALKITEAASVISREEGLTGHAEAAEIRRELH